MTDNPPERTRQVIETDAPPESGQRPGPQTDDQARSDGAGGRSGARVAVVVLAVVTVVLAATGGWLATRIHRADRDEDLRRSALRVASAEALTLLEVSESNVDGKIRELLAGSTGDFKRQLQNIRSSFGDVVKKGKVTSKGQVDAAGLSSLDHSSATVILALSSTVTNSQTEQPEGRAYRISVTLLRERNRWLVSGMEFAP